MKKILLPGLLAVFLALTLTINSHAVSVDLELILAADVSGSIDATDFALQRAGFEAAFRSAGVIDAIENGAIGSIAVTLWDFASDINVAVDWMLIDDAASSNAFADLVAAAPQAAGIGLQDGQTNLINTAGGALGNNNYEGTRNVLDIASEGVDSDSGDCSADSLQPCPSVQAARDAFVAGGGIINAIWLNDRDWFGLDPGDNVNALAYGALNVIGGPGSFQMFAEDFTQFASAIEAKIIREVVPTPEPASMLLFGTGIAGLVGLRIRRKK